MKKPLLHIFKIPEKKIYIYGLCDPDTDEIRYVGLATTGLDRIIQHYETSINLKKCTAVKSWIKSLKIQNKMFKVIYLEYFEKDGKHLDEAEIFWIGYFKMLGANLLNHDFGGRMNYLNNPINVKIRTEKIIKVWENLELRQKQSEICKKINGTPEKREYFRQTTNELLKDPEHYKKCLKNLEKARIGQKTEEAIKNRKLGNTQRIILKDDLGNIYNSMPEAAKALGVGVSTIHKALFGGIKTCKGRILTKISGGIVENPKIVIYEKKGRKPIENPIVDQFGNIYTNIVEASKKTGVSLRVIHRILNGEIKNPRKGIIFKYCDK